MLFSLSNFFILSSSLTLFLRLSLDWYQSRTPTHFCSPATFSPPGFLKPSHFCRVSSFPSRKNPFVLVCVKNSQKYRTILACVFFSKLRKNWWSFWLCAFFHCISEEIGDYFFLFLFVLLSLIVDLSNVLILIRSLMFARCLQVNFCFSISSKILMLIFFF